MPWDDDDPILFHVLTTLDRGTKGAAELGRLVRDGVSLAPARGRGSAGRVKDIDARAGDDRYVFLSAGRMYRGDDSDAGGWLGGRDGYAEPALAFRWADVARRGPIGWRPHDMLGPYEALVRRARRASRQPPTDDHLRALAEAATVWDGASVRSLARLWLASLKASGDERAGRRVAAEAKAVWAPFAEGAAARLAGVPLARASDVRWGDPFRVASVRASVRNYGSPPMRWPEVLVAMFGPELLLLGTLPVRSASWYLDAADHLWKPMDRHPDLAWASPS